MNGYIADIYQTKTYFYWKQEGYPGRTSFFPGLAWLRELWWKSGGPKGSAQERVFPPSKLLLCQVAYKSMGTVKTSLHWRIPRGVMPSINNLQKTTNVGVFMATACMGNFSGTVSVDGWEPSSSCGPAEIHLSGASAGLAGSSPSLRCGCRRELYLLSAFTSLGEKTGSPFSGVSWSSSVFWL